MNVKHWFIGCAFGFVGIGTAMAASADQSDVAATSHMSPDRGVRITADNDGACPTRECPASDESSEPRANRPDAGTGRSGGGTSTPPLSSRRAHLGWQSLLPGSIQ